MWGILKLPPLQLQKYDVVSCKLGLLLVMIISLDMNICSNITNSKLMCKTSPKESPGKGRILVEYGKAHVSGEDYLYTPNPKVHSISPHNTIPV